MDSIAAELVCSAQYAPNRKTEARVDEMDQLYERLVQDGLDNTNPLCVPLDADTEGGTAHGSGLGVHRWVVEQTIALLHWFRRLLTRWEIRDDIHEAFLTPRAGNHLLATPQ
ncbi:hypothetical protein [Streptosporangium sp. CA-115845]|uniref:hypothetical protein n=1 Tax=Streptosporangium sp. CA-115845 TaxID=3240071 RepID=UPI003D94CECF